MNGKVKAVDFTRRTATLETDVGEAEVRIDDPDRAASMLFQMVVYQGGQLIPAQVGDV